MLGLIKLWDPLAVVVRRSASGPAWVDAPPAEAARASLWPPLGLSAMVFLAALAFHWPLKLDHDVSFFLAAARELSQGKTLYDGLIDFNTPGAYGPAFLALGLSAATHAPLDLAEKAVIFALAGLSLAASFAVLSPMLRKPGVMRWILAVGLPAVALFLTPAIGIREHLVVLGLTPWALSIAMADEKRSLALNLAVGAAAGAVLFLKPHFVIFAAALGAVDLIRARFNPLRAGIATWAAGVVSIGLYAWLMLGMPNFAREMLPLALATYGPLHASADDNAALARACIAAATLAPLLLLAVIATRGARKLPWPALMVAGASAAAALVIYLAQHLGFAYQLAPLKAVLALSAVFALGWSLEAAPSSSPLARFAPMLSALGAMIALSWSPNVLEPYPTRRDLMAEPAFAALQPSHPGAAVLAISTAVDPIAESFSLGDARWSGPLLEFLPIAALIEQNGRFAIDNPPPADVRAKWTQWLRGRVLKGFTADPPERVLVETTEKPFFFDHAGFDMLAWLLEDPRLADAWRSAGLHASGAPIEWRNRTYQLYVAGGAHASASGQR